MSEYGRRWQSRSDRRTPIREELKTLGIRTDTLSVATADADERAKRVTALLNAWSRIDDEEHLDPG